MGATTLDPYATLGIPVGASREEAARAHRRLAKAYHPDINPGPKASERMRRINEAWRILSDPVRRSRYDADRRTTAWPAADSAGFGQRAGTTTWAPWPESRHAGPRMRRPQRPDPVEASFGDRPAVFVTVWVALMVLFFLGTWLGNLAP